MPITTPQRALDLTYAPLRQATHAMESLMQMLSGAKNDLDPENLYWLILPIQEVVTCALDELTAGLPPKPKEEEKH